MAEDIIASYSLLITTEIFLDDCVEKLQVLRETSLNISAQPLESILTLRSVEHRTLR
jgi:hypothetical protein